MHVCELTAHTSERVCLCVHVWTKVNSSTCRVQVVHNNVWTTCPLSFIRARELSQCVHFCSQIVTKVHNGWLVGYLLTYVLTYLVGYLLTFVITYLLTYLLIYLLTWLLSYLVTWLLNYLLGYLVTDLLTYLVSYLLRWYLFDCKFELANETEVITTYGGN